MFSKSAAFYDAIYAWKDYAQETARLRELIVQHKRTDGNMLLEVACGTGQHLAFLQNDFQVEGLDLDPELLAVAQQKHPDLRFHHANMLDFALQKQFDVVTCLFSSIGYVRTVANLRQVIQNTSEHLKPGGVLIIEPWFTRDQFIPNHVTALLVDQPDLKIARVAIGRLEGDLSVLEFQYLVATPEGIEHFAERHEMGLFGREDYLAAFEAADLQATHDEHGLMGRGLFIGMKR